MSERLRSTASVHADLMAWAAAAETLLPGVDGRGDVHETEGFCGHLQPPRKADLQAFKCEHTPDKRTGLAFPDKKASRERGGA